MSISQAELARKWNVSRQYIYKLVKTKGLPLDSVEAAEQWRKQNLVGSINNDVEENRGDQKGDNNSSVSSKETSLEGLRSRVQQAELDAYALLEEARKTGELAAMLKLVTIYEKSASALVKVEKEITELETQKGVLIRTDEAKKLITKTLGVVSSQLKQMPRMIGPRANTLDPQHAQNELQRWVDDLLKTIKNLL